MSDPLVEVKIFGMIPTMGPAHTIGIFLGNEEKTFCIHVDPAVGQAIAILLRGERTARPITHQLIGLIFQAFSIRVDRIVINDLRDDTYFARLSLSAANEVHHKLSEIDARPSDCLALALEAGKPIFVAQRVWNQVADVSDQFQQLKQKFEQESEDEDSPDDED